jgi:hypothetical protein
VFIFFVGIYEKISICHSYIHSIPLNFIRIYQQKMFSKATNFLTKLEHNFTHQEGSDGWSHICGGVGGQVFEFVNQKLLLVGVRGRAGANIDQLQFLFVDPHTGHFQSTPEVGGNGGHPFAVECPPGQWISKINVWAGTMITALQFETNTGMKTEKFGGKGGF